MGKVKKDYFGLDYTISVILAIFPITAWILGIITRLQEGKIIAAVIRIFGGFNIIWICDIIFMIKDKKIFRVLDI